MGQGRAVKPRPQGDAPPGQGLPHRLAVPALRHEGHHAGLVPEVPVPEHPDPRQTLQTPGGPQGHLPLPGGDALHPLPPDEPDALQQSRDARHVVGPGLQPVRQVRGHILQAGHAAGAAVEQRLPLRPAQQQSRALGAVQALVTGHGHKGRPPGPPAAPPPTGRRPRSGAYPSPGSIGRCPPPAAPPRRRWKRGCRSRPGAASAGWPGEIPPPPGPVGRAACRSPSRKAPGWRAGAG